MDLNTIMVVKYRKIKFMKECFREAEEKVKELVILCIQHK